MEQEEIDLRNLITATHTYKKKRDDLFLLFREGVISLKEWHDAYRRLVDETREKLRKQS